LSYSVMASILIDLIDFGRVLAELVTLSRN
jgi:hypothetical protein